MRLRPTKLVPLANRGPLPTAFVITSMPVGGAETLLVNLIRRMNHIRFSPELYCLKELGPLGEELAKEIPVFSNLLARKTDVRILPRLTRLFVQRNVGAVITVGAGDKMFWGRLAAKQAHVPVIASALHSTGWPDGIGRLNRMLTPITDAFIAVAGPHGQHLVEQEGFPARKVVVIPNGVDVDRFALDSASLPTRAALGLSPKTPVAGIVAALRHEKNHALFLQAAAEIRKQVPEAVFLIVGDGPERPALEQLARELGLSSAVRFLGTRSDIPELLSTMDVFVLTSRMEANPVSILEAMAAGKPVVAPNVGSISQSVEEGVTGYLTDQGDGSQTAQRVIQLLENPARAEAMGRAGRRVVVEHGSLDVMVSGYERLISDIYMAKCRRQRGFQNDAAETLSSSTPEEAFADAT